MTPWILYATLWIHDWRNQWSHRSIQSSTYILSEGWVFFIELRCCIFCVFDDNTRSFILDYPFYLIHTILSPFSISSTVNWILKIDIPIIGNIRLLISVFSPVWSRINRIFELRIFNMKIHQNDMIFDQHEINSLENSKWRKMNLKFYAPFKIHWKFSLWVYLRVSGNFSNILRFVDIFCINFRYI